MTKAAMFPPVDPRLVAAVHADSARRVAAVLEPRVLTALLGALPPERRDEARVELADDARDLAHAMAVDLVRKVCVEVPRA